MGLALLGCSVGRGAAGRLRCVPSRASPWDGGVGEGPMGLTRKGCSVGWSVAADCGVCPPGRVHGTEALGRAYGANSDGLFRRMECCGRLRRVPRRQAWGCRNRQGPGRGGIGWERNPPTDSVHWPPAPPAGRTGFPGGSAPPRPGRSGGPPIPPPATAPGRTAAAPPPGGRRAG